MDDISTQIEAFAETVAETFDHLGAADDAVDAVREQGEAIADEAAALEARVDDVEDEQDEHDMRLNALGAGIESVNDDIATLEDDVADANPGGDGGETPTDDWTPIERLSIMGEDAIEEHVGPSDRRAVEVYTHWHNWATRTPKGLVLKTGKDGLRDLLSTAVDERLSWKLVYRACRRVEALSKGRITFFKNSDGELMLQQHDVFASRQAQASGGSGSLSASSAGT
ncbi:hypothetical protein DMJ13_27365 [halophilic archaeon]|nr:hypothetical protein DMJ13_27365 [halophilic archaeon]